MNQTEFRNFQCWHDERIEQVINKEAVSVDRVDFLATHAPLLSIRYENAPHQVESTSEEGLLHELRARATESLHTFLVIQGIPGTGKSHLIRWLKERYEAENGESDSDVVLLIERAESSLRGTLLQILRSPVFHGVASDEQIEKLRRATEQLSKDALGDSILGDLLVATKAEKLPEDELPKPRIANNIEAFLLDLNVRRELKKPGGPIERLTQFLAKGRAVEDSAPARPEFQGSDFDFKPDVLRSVRDEGRPETRMLVDGLVLREELRSDLARYLNRLVSFAVQRSTSMSAEDLKQIFYELRRELRRQNRNLALFIEDITAFTGLDAGLVDVLATQHTGEGNREYCRLVSVVGITDDYYADRFPPNMKQRVTYRVSLNATVQDAKGSTHLESDLLRDADATADFAARYLNAMRVKHERLEQWMQDGARSERLPIACSTCSVRGPCHAAFGYVELNTNEGESSRAGLYPYNRDAVWRMYQGIDNHQSSRTPRSLLNVVLESVLRSHGDGVRKGTFPPAPKDMSDDFSTPPLTKPLQANTIRTQAGIDAPRVESLVRFWGNQTVDAATLDGHKMLGGLREEVFRAFSVPLIEGERIGEIIDDDDDDDDIDIDPPPPPPPDDPLFADIEQWTAGRKLQRYEEFRKRLTNLVQSSIDWEAHGVSAVELDDRLTPRRFTIEGQSGGASGDYLTLERSPETQNLLLALVDIGSGFKPMDPATAGAHLATLSTWLRKHEERLVHFVRQPTSEETAPVPLREILLFDGLLVAWSRDMLKLSRSSTEDLLLDVVNSCVTGAGTPSGSGTLLTSGGPGDVHSEAWRTLLRRIRPEDVSLVQRDLLRSLNRAQGDASSVKFIDAAIALDILDSFDKRSWRLTPINAVNPAVAGWGASTRLYTAFQQLFDEVLRGERDQITGWKDAIDRMVGGAPLEDVFQAISDVLTRMRNQQEAYSFQIDEELTPQGLRRALGSLQSILEQKIAKRLALALSGGSYSMRRALQYLHYLEAFVDLVEKKDRELAIRMEKLTSDDSDMAQLLRQIETGYADLEARLKSTVDVVAPKEVAL